MATITIILEDQDQGTVKFKIVKDDNSGRKIKKGEIGGAELIANAILVFMDDLPDQLEQDFVTVAPSSNSVN